jgi:hypothetical protein
MSRIEEYAKQGSRVDQMTYVKFLLCLFFENEAGGAMLL